MPRLPGGAAACVAARRSCCVRGGVLQGAGAIACLAGTMDFLKNNKEELAQYVGFKTSLTKDKANDFLTGVVAGAPDTEGAEID